MKKNFSNRTVLVISTIIAVLIMIIIYQTPFNNGWPVIPRNSTALPLPPLLEDQNPSPDTGEFHLVAQQSTKEFIKGKASPTYGYNGDYLGPVIRMRRGEIVSIHVENQLNEATTIHWHGMELPGEMDGGPLNGIQPNEVWTPQFTIDQPAATLWYHPHPMHNTGAQVFKGLAGLIYIEDEISEKLDIPKEYGYNDFPLIIQDRRFTQNGDMPYDLGMMDVMRGFQGDTFLINGAINPYLEVPRGKVRLRILNGSNARIYNLSLNKSEYFWQIATDGGFLETPVELKQLLLGPAERAEIIVDFSSFIEGSKISLLDGDLALMRFNVSGELEPSVDLPEKLVTIPRIQPSEATVNRQFAFQGMGSMVNINGKQMDINRIDEELQLNATEIWEISNPSMQMMGMTGGMAHPFHAHGVQFQILERNGQKPPPNENGWKDSILVPSGETVKVIATFKYPGIFMYHCHILEHEDAGMMGQFRVR